MGTYYKVNRSRQQGVMDARISILVLPRTSSLLAFPLSSTMISSLHLHPRTSLLLAFPLSSTITTPVTTHSFVHLLPRTMGICMPLTKMSQSQISLQLHLLHRLM